MWSNICIGEEIYKEVGDSGGLLNEILKLGVMDKNIKVKQWVIN